MNEFLITRREVAEGLRIYGAQNRLFRLLSLAAIGMFVALAGWNAFSQSSSATLIVGGYDLSFWAIIFLRIAVFTASFLLFWGLGRLMGGQIAARWVERYCANWERQTGGRMPVKVTESGIELGSDSRMIQIGKGEVSRTFSDGRITVLVTKKPARLVMLKGDWRGWAG
jgi:hypothetical protein